MVKSVLLLLVVGLTIYAAIDCLGSDTTGARTLPKAGWLALIVLVPLVGAGVWLTVGRQQLEPSGTARRVTAPDDDPDFLASLRERGSGPQDGDDDRGQTPS